MCFLIINHILTVHSRWGPVERKLNAPFTIKVFVDNYEPVDLSEECVDEWVFKDSYTPISDNSTAAHDKVRYCYYHIYYTIMNPCTMIWAVVS